jgi:8-oxo-dGTP pyrophosphatase MutT (NUDIX family)
MLPGACADPDLGRAHTGRRFGGHDGRVGTTAVDAHRELAARATGLEADDLAELSAVASGEDAWDRTTPLHLTGSALVVHPPTRRVLLRWHQRQRAWLQVGGHGDPGETEPLAIALREGVEETGLTDLRPWPGPDAPTLLHAVIVSVPANDREPAHRHGDLRYLLATDQPDRIVAEDDGAPLRWLTADEALELTSEDNLRETLRRAAALLAG